MGIVHAQSGVVVAAERNINVIRFLIRPEAAHLRAMEAAFKRTHDSYPQGVAVIILATDATWLPQFSDEFRRAVTQLIAGTEEGGLGSAFVLTGNGMLMAAMRAFISGAFLMSGSREPYRLFKERQPAAEWVSQVASAGLTWRTAEVLRILDEVDGAEAPSPTYQQR